MIQSFDLAQDHFALFGLPRTQALDAERLEARYRELQEKVHPDRYAHLSDAEKRQAMQWASRVNEAYLTLKDPLRRARYLLELAGHDVRLETNTAMPVEFLMAQMELRESVAGAKAAGDTETLDEYHRRLRRTIRDEYAALQTALDAGELARAGELVRQLMFQEKLLQEIGDALEVLET
ncbi:Fe-S protein assembly co-chaperone HscB [Sulfuricystis multivorans]|uniref:Fe-S protein assembly co-chaperone HscB n=1 Tax=Sulfuricystis multivorans TaxID=2211108 RepID=UPI000F8462E0|nr:Fe-S protein assembly co-chaperone HscB [Sulfuricystis multivorans]